MTKGSATVNFDRSFRALSKREDSRPCAPAQGRDGKEDENRRSDTTLGDAQRLLGAWRRNPGGGGVII